MADVSKSVAILFEGTDSGASAAADRVSASMLRMQETQRANALAAAEADAKWANSSIKADQLAKDATSAAGALKLQGEEAETAGNKNKKLGDDVDQLTKLYRVLAASVVIKEFVDANVAIENFSRGMTAITGSTAEAANALTYVRTTSETLGIGIKDAAENFLQLTAASKGTALEGQATRDIFESVAHAMGVLGKGGEDTTGVLNAIQQMMSKGVVQAEELKGQLGDRLPGALQIAARAMDTTTENLLAMMKDGLVPAAEFLPKFAEELNNTFGNPERVASFTAELTRMNNALQDIATGTAGQGIFRFLTAELEDLKPRLDATKIEFDAFGAAGTALKALFNGGSFTQFIADMNAIDVATENATLELNRGKDAVNLFAYEAEQFGKVASEGVNLFAYEAERSFTKTAQETAALDAQLKALGLDPAKMRQLADLPSIFDELANNPNVSGDQILAGFKKTLSSLTDGTDLDRLMESLSQAFELGKLTVDQYVKAVGEVQKKYVELTPSAKAAEEQTKKFEDATKKAKEEATKAALEAQKLALELEKLASNERIKNMEFTVNLKIAELEETTKRITANFESLDNTITSTADVIKALFSQIGAFDQLSLTAQRLVLDQLDAENKLRRDAFELQKLLTEAQIKNLEAQTVNLSRGDAIIKIDGAGLQPQLEAFMWEILKSIQTKVNSQGLAMLLGT